MSCKKKPIVPREITRLISSSGFIEAYYEFLPKHENKKRTYEHVNGIYKEWFGDDRYGSYHVFMRVLYRSH